MAAATTTIKAWRCGRLSSSSSSLSSLSCRVRTHRSRPFFNLAAAALGQAQNADSAHTLTTERTLPYADRDLFRIIADVDAYDQFLPHCTSSRVTRWRVEGGDAGPADTHTDTPSWPARADLTVGWGPLSQTYSSRVYCIPGRGVVEAVSGQRGSPSLTADERAELGLQQNNDREEAEDIAEAARVRACSPDDDPFESLVTRWTVRPLDGGGGSSASKPDAGLSSSSSSPWSYVELRIRFQFRNPLYQLAAAQVGNEMAAKMIEAFESRAKDVLGPRGPGRL